MTLRGWPTPAFWDSPPDSVGELRRWYRREMVRIQAASVCLSEPIFETLLRTSDLADAVIAKVYDIAVAGDSRLARADPTRPMTGPTKCR